MTYNFVPRNALDAMARDDTAALTGVENSDDYPPAGFSTRCQRNENKQNSIPRTPLGSSRACPRGTRKKKDSIIGASGRLADYGGLAMTIALVSCCVV